MVTIDINMSLIFQIVNFLIMIIVMNHLLYRPIRKIIRERKERFEGLESQIGGLNTQVDDSAKKMEADMAEARRAGFLKKDEIKGQGLEEEKIILQAASSEADTEIQKMKDQIKGEIVAAREALQADLAVFSRELAQKVLGRGLS